MNNKVKKRGTALLLVLTGIMGQFTYSTTSVAAQNIEESVTELNLVNNGDFETPNVNLQKRNIWQLNAEMKKLKLRWLTVIRLGISNLEPPMHLFYKK